jgi:hypothetical protein
MKKDNLLRVLVLLLSLSSLTANCQEFAMAGNYVKHKKTKNSIEFQCTNSKIRVDNCADDILRIRMRPGGEFKPDETFVVIRYDWPVTSYSIKDKGDYIAIGTQRMQIKAFKSPFHFAFFDLGGNPVNKDWNYRFYGRLRYRLMPYIYTYARDATINGSPLVRALVLENQNDPKTYDSFCEYLLGKEILIAPLWSDTTFYRDIYLPEGEWIDMSYDKTYQGKQTINYHAPIDKVPIFVKAGAIIQMAPDNQHYVDEILSPLTIHIYPDGTSIFDLYEDGGESYDYEKGIYTITTFSSWDNGKELLIKKAVPSGKFRISEREHLYCVHQKPEVKKVIQDGRTLPVFISLCDFNSAEEGWMQESEGKKLLWVKIKSEVNDAIELKIVGD